MEDKKKLVSGKDLFPVIEELLKQGKRAVFYVSGTSMTPWIINNRDSVELISANGLKLKKGDIIFFQPFAGKYVLHRITKVVTGGYITTGDGNLYRDAFIVGEKVIGKVVLINRKNKEIDCDSMFWKCIFHIWMLLFPIRKWLLKMLHIMSKFKSIIYKKIK